MTINKDELNKSIRKSIEESTTDENFTGSEMNEFIRGKSIDKIKRARVPVEQKLTSDELKDALEYKEANGVKWSEAVSHVLDQGKKNKTSPMNTYIRSVCHKPPLKGEDNGSNSDNQK